MDERITLTGWGLGHLPAAQSPLEGLRAGLCLP